MCFLFGGLGPSKGSRSVFVGQVFFGHLGYHGQKTAHFPETSVYLALAPQASKTPLGQQTTSGSLRFIIIIVFWGGRTGTRRFWAVSRLQPGPGEPRPGPASAPCRSHTYILPVQRSGAAALCRSTVELTVGACTRPLRGEICPSWPLPLLDAASGGGLGATLPQQSTLIAKHGSLCGPYMDPHMDPIWIDVFG